MSEIQAQISVLKQTADPAVADAIARLIDEGEDHELNRINVLDFSKRSGLDEERVISGFLHASRLGLFDLTWNVLCPGCGGVLDAHSTLKSLRPDDYHCGLCACGYEASVDEQVEVAFTVSPRTRRIAAHDPNTLPVWEYFKQIFWSSGVDLNKESFAQLTDEVTLDTLELPAGEKAVMSLKLPSDFIIVFEPVTHSAQFIDVQGEPTKERQQLSLVYSKTPTPTGGTRTMRPGPFRLSLDNQADVRVLPSVFIAGDAMHQLIGKRKPFLTAQRDTTELVVTIGIHEGPCLAVMLNERQDYFGQTVNIAARVQSLSTSQEIHITGPVIDSPAVAEILAKASIKPIQKQAALRGIADKMVVYEIP